jgi:hypothetical protein
MSGSLFHDAEKPIDPIMAVTRCGVIAVTACAEAKNASAAVRGNA